MIDLDKEIELYKSKVAFYESQNTRGEYAVTVRELKFVVETLKALRSERSQGDLISRSALKEQFIKAGKDYNHECVIEMLSANCRRYLKHDRMASGLKRLLKMTMKKELNQRLLFAVVVVLLGLQD